VIIAALVLIVATLLVINDNSKNDELEATRDLRANLYSDGDYIYTTKTTFNDDDCDRKSYCDYSDYDCDHDDYSCYFKRKEICDERKSDDEDGKTIIYVIGERDSERYSIKDYKYGYTYRTTEEYLQKYGLKIVVEDDLEEDSEESFYYRYVPHMREYEKVVCYDSAPEVKLFYEKCPTA